MLIANTVNSKSEPHLYYQESLELCFPPNQTEEDRHHWYVCTQDYWRYFNVEVKGHSLHMHRNGPCIHSIFHSIFRSIFRSIPHSVFYTLPICMVLEYKRLAYSRINLSLLQRQSTSQEKHGRFRTGCRYSHGLDYWTGLLDSKFNHKSHSNYQNLLLVLI